MKKHQRKGGETFSIRWDSGAGVSGSFEGASVSEVLFFSCRHGLQPHDSYLSLTNDD